MFALPSGVRIPADLLMKQRGLPRSDLADDAKKPSFGAHTPVPPRVPLPAPNTPTPPLAPLPAPTHPPRMASLCMPIKEHAVERGMPLGGMR